MLLKTGIFLKKKYSTQYTSSQYNFGVITRNSCIRKKVTESTSSTAVTLPEMEFLSL